jgi:ABC-type hemin transport system ATPase subunit
MEVVMYSGTTESMVIDGVEVKFEPGKVVVVPDDIGKALLLKSNYITPEQHKKWLLARDEKAKRYAAELAKKKKEASK